MQSRTTQASWTVHYVQYGYLLCRLSTAELPCCDLGSFLEKVWVARGR